MLFLGSKPISCVSCSNVGALRTIVKADAGVQLYPKTISGPPKMTHPHIAETLHKLLFGLCVFLWETVCIVWSHPALQWMAPDLGFQPENSICPSKGRLP